jgi:hypothetical protein
VAEPVNLILMARIRFDRKVHSLTFGDLFHKIGKICDKN